jgi:hypothetical protein
VLVVALFAYAALYPQPYLAEALRDVPIAVSTVMAAPAAVSWCAASTPRNRWW